MIGNARLKLKTYIFHERRAILMYTVATVLVSSLIYSQDSNPWNAIVIIAVYGYISGDTSRNQMFRGGGSIRGLVLTPLLSFMAFGVITVLGSLTEVVDVDQCYGAGFLKWLGDIFDTPNPVGQSEITMGRFTASIGQQFPLLLSSRSSWRLICVLFRLSHCCDISLRGKPTGI